jgi:hypothetical protein
VIVAVALMVLLVRELVTRQVYTPEAFLKALSIVTLPNATLGTGIPRGSRIWKVVIIGIFLVIQRSTSCSPSLTVTSSNKGSTRTAE